MHLLELFFMFPVSFLLLPELHVKQMTSGVAMLIVVYSETVQK